jgi:hypothetical protein
MPNNFYVTGLIVISNTGRSFHVFALADGKKIFIGLISRKALSELLQRQINTADICKFSENTAMIQEPLSFSWEQKP